MEARQITGRLEHGLPWIMPELRARRLRWWGALRPGALAVRRLIVEADQDGRVRAHVEAEGEPAPELQPWTEPTHRERTEQIAERRKLRTLLLEHGPVGRVAGWATRRHGWTLELQAEPELLARAIGADAPGLLERSATRVLLRVDDWPELHQHVRARLTG